MKNSNNVSSRRLGGNANNDAKHLREYEAKVRAAARANHGKFTHNSGDKYHVTGTDRDGRRFKVVTSNPFHALGVNVYRGSLWQQKAGDSKRRLIRRTYN